MELKDIVTFYTGVLIAAGFRVQEDGTVHLNQLGVEGPMTIDGKPLVLPTDEMLRNGAVSGKLIFHPACESFIRKESPVQKKLREAMSTRINLVTLVLMRFLMDLASDVTKQQTLTPTQSQYLTELAKVGTVADSTYKNLEKVLRQVGSEKKLIRSWIKVDQLHEGVQYLRVANVSFPMLEERNNNADTIFGVKCSPKANKEIILTLFEYIFPNAHIPGTYSYGTKNMDAPNFIALLRSYEKVARATNRVVELFRDKLDLFTELEHGASELYIPLDSWIPYVDNIAQIRAMVPKQEGNEGEPIDDGSGQGASIQPNARPAGPVVYQQPATTNTTTTAPATSQTASNLELMRGPKNDALSVIRPPKGASALPPSQQPKAKETGRQEINIGSAIPQPSYGYQQPVVPNYGYAQPQQQQIPAGYTVAPNGQLVPLQQQPPMVQVVDPATQQLIMVPAHLVNPQPQPQQPVYSYQQPQVQPNYGYQQPQIVGKNSAGRQAARQQYAPVYNNQPAVQYDQYGRAIASAPLVYQQPAQPQGYNYGQTQPQQQIPPGYYLAPNNQVLPIPAGYTVAPNGQLVPLQQPAVHPYAGYPINR
jgi:hypothetical protein